MIREAVEELGSAKPNSIDEGKGMVAKMVAERLIEKGLKEGDPNKYIPKTIQDIHDKLRELKMVTVCPEAQLHG